MTYVAACYIDLALVIDCSGSIRKANEPGEDNWEYIIEFMVDLVNNVNVGDDDTHVAAVSFGKQLLTFAQSFYADYHCIEVSLVTV